MSIPTPSQAIALAVDSATSKAGIEAAGNAAINRGGIPGFDDIGRFYVSVTDGDDLNDGRTAEFPVKSFTRLKEVVQPYSFIYLKRGDVWDTDIEVVGGKVIASASQSKVESGHTCLESDSTLATCEMRAYGVGSAPKIKCNITVSSSAISLDSGTTYTFIVVGDFIYNLHVFGAAVNSACYPSVKIRGRELVRVVDLATAQSTPGSYYVSAVGAEWTYYAHGYSSEDLTLEEITVPFKSYGINRVAPDNTPALVSNLTIEGACEKDGNEFFGSLVQEVFIKDSAVHHALYEFGSTVKNVTHASTSAWIFEGLEMFTETHSPLTLINGIDVRVDKTISQGMFSHSIEGAGIDKLIIKDYSDNKKANIMCVLNDTINASLDSIHRSDLAGVFCRKASYINSYNGGALSYTHGTLTLSNCDLQKNFSLARDVTAFITINRPDTIEFINCITNRPLIAYVNPVGAISINNSIAGTRLVYRKSTIIIDDNPWLIEPDATAGAIPQDVELEFYDSVVARPRMKKDFFGWGTEKAGYALIDFAKLSNGGSLTLKADNTSFEKVIFTTAAGATLRTIAAVQAEYPDFDANANCRYGMVENAYANQSISDLIGDDSTWATDPDDINNYLITLNFPKKDAVMAKVGANYYNLRFNGISYLGIAINDAKTERFESKVFGTWTGTPYVKATTFDEFYDMMLNGYIIASVPKADVSDASTVAFGFWSWDYDGNFERSQLVNNRYVPSPIDASSLRGYNSDARYVVDAIAANNI